MPEVPIDHPETQAGDKTVATDLDQDRADMILAESLQNHSALMHETRANSQSSHNILRHSGVRKFDQVDPIEAAAVEMILGKAVAKT